jgi:hypothetical protein
MCTGQKWLAIKSTLVTFLNVYWTEVARYQKYIGDFLECVLDRSGSVSEYIDGYLECCNDAWSVLRAENYLAS